MASKLSLQPESAMVPRSGKQHQAVMSRELLPTASLVPDNLRHAAAAENPIIQVIYNIFQRFRSHGGGNFENLVTLVALYKIVSPAWRRLRALFLRFFTSQVTILESDPAAQEVIQWMSAEIFEAGRNINATIATGQQGQGHLEQMMGGGALNPYANHMARLFGVGSNFGSGSKSRSGDTRVQCLPPMGYKLFWVGFRPFLYYRSGRQQAASQSAYHRTGSSALPATNVVLYTPGWSLEPLLGFVEQCRQYNVQHMMGSMFVHYAVGPSRTVSGSMWSRIIKPKRKMETVDLDEDVKTQLMNDAVYYCSEESKKFYADCGIPYRRGYLFYGPPGTGKTSFSAALAGHLDCNLYIISLSSGDVSDENLRLLFMSLPTKCVVVIEDIDSCGIGREHIPGTPSPDAKAGWKKSPRLALSLSGVLNAIDGNASAEGRLLIMTSNQPDTLDEALIRPGRIDMKVHFGKMKQRAIHDMFKRLVGRGAIASKGFSEAQIEDHATTFAAKVPSNTFTPAELQNFLQDCRGDPVKAVAEIDAWVNTNRSVVVETAGVSGTNTPSTNGAQASLISFESMSQSSIFWHGADEETPAEMTSAE